MGWGEVEQGAERGGCKATGEGPEQVRATSETCSIHLTKVSVACSRGLGRCGKASRAMQCKRCKSAKDCSLNFQ